MRIIAATDTTTGLMPVVDAAQLEPIVIRQEDHDVAVVLSMSEYDRLRATTHLAQLAEHERWVAEASAVDRISDERLVALLSDDEG